MFDHTAHIENVASVGSFFPPTQTTRGSIRRTNETYVKVSGQRKYLCRAVDRAGTPSSEATGTPQESHDPCAEFVQSEWPRALLLLRLGRLRHVPMLCSQTVVGRRIVLILACQGVVIGGGTRSST